MDAESVPEDAPVPSGGAVGTSESDVSHAVAPGAADSQAGGPRPQWLDHDGPSPAARAASEVDAGEAEQQGAPVGVLLGLFDLLRSRLVVLQPQQGPRLLQSSTDAARGVQAAVTDLAKGPGQHVLDEAPDGGRIVQPADLLSPGPEGEPAAIDVEYPGVGDRDAVGVAAEVLHEVTGCLGPKAGAGGRLCRRATKAPEGRGP